MNEDTPMTIEDVEQLVKQHLAEADHYLQHKALAPDCAICAKVRLSMQRWAVTSH